MEKWEERIAALKKRFTERITTESSADDINDNNNAISEIDALNEQHNALKEENAKLKETIVRMVQTSGSSDKPSEASDVGSKPKTLEEIIAEKQAEQNKENK